MDAATRQMVAQAYDETVDESLSQGHPADIAHREGVTAAAMFLSSMIGVEDAEAVAQVEELGLQHR